VGTSKSSDGPGPGNFLPDYADPASPEPDAPDDGDQNDGNDSESGPENESADPVPPVVPDVKAARFIGTRSALGRFANSGSKDDLTNALGHYTAKGYGGSATATARQHHVTSSVGRLNSVLSNLGNGSESDPLAGEDLTGKTSDEIVDAIIDAVAPVDGTQDAELERTCMAEAFAEVLEADENADAAALTAEQRASVIRSTLSLCVSRRFMLDVGKHLREKAGSAKIGASRIQEVKSFIREEVESNFRSIATGPLPTGVAAFQNIVTDVLREQLSMFLKVMSNEIGLHFKQ